MSSRLWGPCPPHPPAGTSRPYSMVHLRCWALPSNRRHCTRLARFRSHHQTTIMLRLVRASVRSGVGDRLRSWVWLRRYQASERRWSLSCCGFVVLAGVVLRVFWVLLVVSELFDTMIWYQECVAIRTSRPSMTAGQHVLQSLGILHCRIECCCLRQGACRARQGCWCAGV